jgi:peroxiredoxin
MDLPFEVTALPPADHPEEGEEAPEFTRPLVNAEYWEDAALSALTEEGPLLLVFHPADGAFPTTYIWRELTERDLEVRAVGVSISSPYEHAETLDDRAFDAHGLYSDPGAGVAELYGVENDLDGMAGVVEHRPAVFLVDGERTVRYAWAASEWPAFPDYDGIEAAVAEL